jgi:hypothetical protein
VEIFCAGPRRASAGPGNLPELQASLEPHLQGSSPWRQRAQAQRSTQELQVLCQIHEVLSPTRAAAERALQDGAALGEGPSQQQCASSGLDEPGPAGCASGGCQLSTIREEGEEAGSMLGGRPCAPTADAAPGASSRSGSGQLQERSLGSSAASATTSTAGGSPSAWKLEQLRLGLEMEMGEELLVRSLPP